MKVNKELLASYLQEQNNNPESIIITMNNFMNYSHLPLQEYIQPEIQSDSNPPFLHLSCLPN